MDWSKSFGAKPPCLRTSCKLLGDGRTDRIHATALFDLAVAGDDISNGARFLASLGRHFLSAYGCEVHCPEWSLRDDTAIRPDAALLSKINSLGSAAAGHQYPLPPHDMVIRPALLAREAIRMERTRLRTGAIASF